MAKRLRPDNGQDDEGMAGTTAGHNSAAREDTILAVCRERGALEAERATLTEQIGELMQKRVKGDLGMKIVDFNLAYRLYKLEGDDRDQCLDAIRECFTALGIGEQLDFLTHGFPKAAGSTPRRRRRGNTEDAHAAA